MEVVSFGQKLDMGCFDLRGIQSDLGLGEKGCLVGAVLDDFQFLRGKDKMSSKR